MSGSTPQGAAFERGPDLAGLAALDVEAFVELALEHVLEAARLDPRPRRRDREPCDVRGTVFGHGLDGSIFGALGEALAGLAWAGHERVERYHAQLAEVDHDATDTLRCRMLASPAADSDAAIGWLIEHRDWYALGWGLTRWPPMDLVAVHAGACTEASYRAMEHAILAFSPPVEAPECRGFGQYELLTVLGGAQLSPPARARLVDLHRRFAG